MSLTEIKVFPACRIKNGPMRSATPSQFQAIQIDWQSASDALSKAEAGVVEALKHFRSSGQDGRLRSALAARQSAYQRLRTLMHAIWSEPI